MCPSEKSSAASPRLVGPLMVWPNVKTHACNGATKIGQWPEEIIQRHGTLWKYEVGLPISCPNFNMRLAEYAIAPKIESGQTSKNENQFSSFHLLGPTFRLTGPALFAGSAVQTVVM